MSQLTTVTHITKHGLCPVTIMEQCVCGGHQHWHTTYEVPGMRRFIFEGVSKHCIAMSGCCWSSHMAMLLQTKQVSGHTNDRLKCSEINYYHFSQLMQMFASNGNYHQIVSSHYPIFHCQSHQTICLFRNTIL